MLFIFRTSGERAFKCEICEKSYKQHSQLTVHRRTHTNPRPKPVAKHTRKCVACGQMFTTLKLLQQHLVDAHIRVVMADTGSEVDALETIGIPI